MDKKQEERLSRYLSLVLRHHPEAAGITLRREGAWAEVDALLRGAKRAGKPLDLPLLEKIVREDGKQRYSFSPDHRYIRANQGHSIPVDLELSPKMPPAVLYHGTGLKYVPSIERQGLLHMRRLYVHLSRDIDTAVAVGQRHGTCFVYRVDAAQMARDGLLFYESVNHVWLTEHVPARYLHPIDG